MGLNKETQSAVVLPFKHIQAVCIPEDSGTRVRAVETFRTIRKRQRLSQKALAAQCDCHISTICQIEKGRMKPSLEKFAALCRALKTSPTKLLPIMLSITNSPPARAKGSVADDLQQRERLRRERRN